MKLYKHQQQVIDEDKKWFGNWRGTGSGKTLTTLMLAKGETLVVVPKQQYQDQMWQKKNEEYGTNVNLKVISKEMFRRDWQKLPQVETLIIDEADNHFGVTPDMKRENKEWIPKTSQLFDATVKYIKRTPPKRLYLLTATPVTKPMHLWAIGKIYGYEWDFQKFRDKYYFEIPLGGYRKMWKFRNTEELRTRLAENVKLLGYTGALSDFVDVPKQTHIVHYVETTPEQDNFKEEIKPEPIIDEETGEEKKNPTEFLRFIGKSREIENGVHYKVTVKKGGGKEDEMIKGVDIINNNKITAIIKFAYEFPKMIVFANYTEQINQIAKELKKEGFEVLTLTGQTKNSDRATLIERAEAMEKCIIVIQSSISAGYELTTFRTTIYASLSRSVRDKIQGDGRNLRIKSLQKNLYIVLVTRGGADEECYKAIQSGVDFNELATSGI